jgi:hypothetical protein
VRAWIEKKEREQGSIANVVTRKRQRDISEQMNAEPSSQFQLTVQSEKDILSPSQQPLFWKLKTEKGNFYFLLRKFQVCSFSSSSFIS